MAEVSLSIDSLLLDSDNPRIGNADSQRDALQKIIDDQGDKLYELAEDISQEGLSPIERLLVLRESPESLRYVSLEGNRRAAALKILVNPHILAAIDIKPSLRKKLEVLATGFKRTSVEPISGFEVATREQGRRWIYLRHTGENEGRGVVSWTGVAAARFRGEDPALQALEFVKAYGGLDSNTQALLGRYFPITTLDRLLSAKSVRRLIGVDISGSKLRTTLPASEVMKPLRRIVLDLAEKKINVSALKSSSQQVDYIQNLPQADRPDMTKAGTPRPIETVSAADFSESVRPKKKRQSSGTGERRTVAPSRLRLNVTDPKTASIFKELKGLKAEEFPNAGAVLLRVFLELSIDGFLTKNGIPLQAQVQGGRTVDKSLARKVQEGIEYLINNQGANRKDFLTVTRGLTVASSPFSVDLLHAYVHNRFVTPKERELLAAWDDAQPLFERLWQ